nr:pantothenate kinase 2 isoform X1 [Ipomoea batatas]
MPILLKLASARRRVGRNKVRYENAWGYYDECRRAVNDTWEGMNGCDIVHKLYCCKEAAWRWGRRTFKGMAAEIISCRQEMSRLRAVRGGGNGHDFIVMQCRRRYFTLLKVQSDGWRQRAKERWYTGGDVNSRFFHNSVNGRRRRNYIRGVRDVGGNLISDEEGMGAVVLSYFTSLYTAEEGSGGPVLECLERKVSISHTNESDILKEVMSTHDPDDKENFKINVIFDLVKSIFYPTTIGDSIDEDGDSNKEDSNGQKSDEEDSNGDNSDEEYIKCLDIDKYLMDLLRYLQRRIKLRKSVAPGFIRFVTEKFFPAFQKGGEPIIVSLDHNGRMVHRNAMHMVLMRGLDISDRIFGGVMMGDSTIPLLQKVLTERVSTVRDLVPGIDKKISEIANKVDSIITDWLRDIEKQIQNPVDSNIFTSEREKDLWKIETWCTKLVANMGEYTISEWAIRHEAFTHIEGHKEFVQIDQNDLFPYLLVNIGSGVSMIKVDGDGKFQRVSGTNVGGGTYWGLGRLLTKCKSFDDLLELSQRGDNRTIDMLVGDIYGGMDYSKIGLSASTIASSFGKTISENKELEDYRPEDISVSLAIGSGQIWMVDKDMCFFLIGGHDIQWVKTFESKVMREIQFNPQSQIQMHYVGSNIKVASMIEEDKDCNVVGHHKFSWIFWARLQSVFLSRIKFVEEAQSDEECDEILRRLKKLLAYEVNDLVVNEWAMLCKGNKIVVCDQGDKMLKVMNEYDKWKENAIVKGFDQAFKDYHEMLDSTSTSLHHHRCALNFDSVSENVKCPQCCYGWIHQTKLFFGTGRVGEINSYPCFPSFFISVCMMIEQEILHCYIEVVAIWLAT